ncbi:MAG: relaxase domain-containing protein [Nitriliruptorales bacterium]
MLSVNKVLAGRGAVDYYLNQTRHGLADYYLPPRPTNEARESGQGAALSAPGSSWWGGGATALGLSGEVQRAQFVPLYAKGVRPDGGYLGRRFLLPEDATAARAAAMRAASRLDDPYQRWMARHEVRRRGGHASVAAWDCTFSPVKSVSLLWAAGDGRLQQQVWAAHVAAVDAGLALRVVVCDVSGSMPDASAVVASLATPTLTVLVAFAERAAIVASGTMDGARHLPLGGGTNLASAAEVVSTSLRDQLAGRGSEVHLVTDLELEIDQLAAFVDLVGEFGVSLLIHTWHRAPVERVVAQLPQLTGRINLLDDPEPSGPAPGT